MTEEVEGVFARSTDGTVGIEEEFACVDPSSHDLVPRFDDLVEGASGELAESIAGELILSEVEIRSGRGDDLADAIRRQRARRRELFALAESKGVALGATGTHPWADFREVGFIDTEHYRRVVEGVRYVAMRNVTFSLHAHVGIHGADRAIAVCDRLRPVLPQLLAISANSVCVDAIDSGLHSARSQSFTRSFPRCGIPEAFGSWAAYKDYIDFLVRTNSIVEFTQVWWSVRPHFSFGTVEVRICDAQSTAAEAEAMAGLITACVLQAARDVDEGRPFDDPSSRLIEENLWRAIRYGMDGKLIDLEAGEEYFAADARQRLADWTAPVRSEHRIELPFPDLNGAQRQRRALDSGASIHEVYADALRETRETYVQEVHST